MSYASTLREALERARANTSRFNHLYCDHCSAFAEACKNVKVVSYRDGERISTCGPCARCKELKGTLIPSDRVPGKDEYICLECRDEMRLELFGGDN